ncbi:ABC transporter substrate-binding protein [Tenacibaculum sp. M341]|uniref:ABC transporter substrate-binding protein n=1 Tax=Tenacibaculum sp. M341 TaxID=2530339 RepID=UPI00104D1D43|nr:helical backbone metal receptor [Tenacibaculum sp. M341]TCI85558.1 cobalamin-binding protein [Tenacibaculum sp. M341]
MKISDQLNRELNILNTPKRIVSLVPSLTELLFDLGLEEQIVGLTKFCIHPYHLKQTKTIVGGTKKIKLDVIKDLKPDIILCNKEENTEEIVNSCNEISIVHVSNIFTLDDVFELIEQYGLIFSCRTEASKIYQKLKFKINDFKNFVNSYDSKTVAYFIWRNPWMAAGNNTFINHLLELNKFDNIYKNKERYPEIQLKKIRLEGDPEIVFLSSEPYPFKEEHAFEVGRCTHHAKTVFVDGELFSWYGSRLLKSFDYFKKLHQRIV